MGAEEDITYLDAIVPVMRRRGVLEFKGTVLGPEPPSTAASDESTQRTFTAEGAEKHARAERRRVTLASSGGPVPRVDSK